MIFLGLGDCWGGEQCEMLMIGSCECEHVDVRW